MPAKTSGEIEQEFMDGLAFSALPPDVRKVFDLPEDAPIDLEAAPNSRPQPDVF